ncbi:MAG TPA: SGNH/GDSL hydrolase family protein [Dongiaceae bacterium]|nr:SGNH/GDSL hydrolase family protein [Dongiaceae bacterium]
MTRRPALRSRPGVAAAIVAALGTLTGFLAAEGIVRLLRVAPDVAFIESGRFRLSANPRLGYEMVPSMRCTETAGRCDFRGPSNSLGFRDREHPLEKEPGTFRVLLLGDSVAQGLRVEDDRRIFPALLEERLRERGIAAEVLNFAVNGYDTRQEVETLATKGLRFRPDLVLVAYCLNDDTRTDGGILAMLRSIEKEQGDRTLDAARLTPWLGESALYRYLRYRVLPAAETARGVPEEERVPVPEALATLRDLARRERFAVLLAVFPRLDALVPYPFDREHAALRALAEADGFAFVDLLPSLRACALAGAEPVGFDAFHPTAYGHACAAAALVDPVAALAHPRPGD